MPVVELRTSGYLHRIDSRDWDRIRGWLDEWLPQLQGMGPIWAQLSALVTYDSRGQITEADWLADSRAFGVWVDLAGVDAGQAVGLIQRHGAQLQAWVDEGADPRKRPGRY
jgi:hypothetical protein